MSLTLPRKQGGYPASVLFESYKGGTQRVVMLPIDFGTSTLGMTRPLEKHSGGDVKHMHVLQQHIYTGEVVCADSQHNCGSSNNAFIPHGVGTLVYLLYAKPVGRGTTVAGLPHTVVIESFGEVEELRGAVLLGVTMYKGSFRFGRRHGSGKLTVYPRYGISCTWNDDAPVLDGTHCILEYFAKINSTPSLDSLTTVGDKKVRSRTTSSGASLDNFSVTVSSQYLGMSSLISSGVTPNRASFSGLVWAEQARFVADGVGEMLYPHGVRYCGCWQCGQRHGFGVEYDPSTNTLYMGSFLYDHRDGPGTLHYCNTGAILCGNWKDGKLTDRANAVLPTRPFVLQGALWKDYENWSFDHGTLLRSCGSLSGLWEPLFVSFDEVLASVTSTQRLLPSTSSVAEGGVSELVATSASDTQLTGDREAENEEEDDSDVQNFLSLLTSMMRRPEFMALLVPFQRCFYFLYKACTGIRPCPSDEGEDKDKEQLSGAVLSEGADLVSQPLSVKPFSSSMSGFSPSRVVLRNSPSDDVNAPWQNTHRPQRDSEVKGENTLPPFLLKLRELGRSGNHEGGIMDASQNCCWSSPSWCEEMRMSRLGSNGNNSSNSNNNSSSTSTSSAGSSSAFRMNAMSGDGNAFHCFHTTRVSEELARRMPAAKLFERAMYDLASFVSSVRLRLLSYVAVHPAAFHISVNEKILAVCWDSVYALVAPVIHDLAVAAEVETTTATTLALQRCAALTRADFIPQSALTETAMNVGGDDTERIITERCTRLFASPVNHARRVVLQTTNGKLLQFGSTVITSSIGNTIGHLYVEGVYASPAEMLEAFAGVHSRAVSLFPLKPILQERWISSSILTAFTHADGLDPRNALNPLALLRILSFLAGDVNPRYPFPRQVNEKSNSKGFVGNQHSYCSDGSCTGSSKGETLTVDTRDTSDGDCVLGPFMNPASSSPKGVSEVLLLLALVRGGVERLQNVYPAIRYSMPIIFEEDTANFIRSPTTYSSTSKNNGSLEERNAVYPLDELGVRTRFVLLVAADFVRRCCKLEYDVLEIGFTNKDNMIVVGDPNDGEGVMRRDPRAPWALCRSMQVMQSVLTDHVKNTIKGEGLSPQQENAMNETIVHSQYEGVASSELLLWIVECIWGVLDSPHHSNTSLPFATHKKSTRHLQQHKQHSVTIPTPSFKQHHVDPIGTKGSVMGEYQAEPTTADQKVGGTRCLSYHWTHFVPFATPSPQRGSGTATSTTTATLLQSSRLLTEGELLQVSLLQQLLADVGVQMEIRMRFCYDNEEDAELLFPMGRPLSLTTGENTSRMDVSPLRGRERSARTGTGATMAPSLGTEETSIRSTTVSCVGKEATLSLYVDPAFLGSRVWEVLADAWLKALITLRAKNASPSQHVRRNFSSS